MKAFCSWCSVLWQPRTQEQLPLECRWENLSQYWWLFPYTDCRGGWCVSRLQVLEGRCCRHVSVMGLCWALGERSLHVNVWQSLLSCSSHGLVLMLDLAGRWAVLPRAAWGAVWVQQHNKPLEHCVLPPVTFPMGRLQHCCLAGFSVGLLTESQTG